MRSWRSIICVFLPFVSGYFLSYAFRTINAVITQPLASEFALDAADLGFLTSVFFLSFALAQIPLGLCLDRFGPRRVQLAMLPIAAGGAMLFSVADGFLALVLGRILIGIGFASALMAGLKAIVLWFPKDHIPVLNGLYVAIGALGAVVASTPAEALINSIGWRGLFAALSATAILIAIPIYLVAPESKPKISPERGGRSANIRSIYTDPTFWRLAPLSAVTVGASWSVQGLWGALWLTDVEGLQQSQVVQYQCLMGLSLCGSALLFGLAAKQLRRYVSLQCLFTIVVLVFIATQTALALRWPVPSGMLLVIIAGAGSATVLSFSIFAEKYPAEVAGQANAALNIIHVSTGFLLQYLTGVVVYLWPRHGSYYPAQAYQIAFAACVAVQLVAFASYMRREGSVRVGRAGVEGKLGLQGLTVWNGEFALARRSVWTWRIVAGLGCVICGFLGAVVFAR